MNKEKFMIITFFFIQEQVFSIKIKNSGSQHEAIVVQIPVQEIAANFTPTLQMPVILAPPELIAIDKKSEQLVDESKYIIVKSPMIGTFYKTAAPDKPPFVNIGDEIKKGQTLCIVEAMKLMNEIESDAKGRITKILVEDGTPVEFGEPLFELEAH